MLSVEKFIETFQNSAIGRRLEKDADKEALALRVPVATEFAELSRSRHGMRATHETRLVPFDRAVDTAQAALDAAVGKRAQARRECLAESGAADQRLRYLESALRAGADPRIDEVRRDLDARLQSRRATLCVSEEVVTADRHDSGARVVVTRTNQAAIEKLMAAYRAVWVDLDRLKLAAPADIEVALVAVVAPVEAAWASIGDLDQA